MKSASESVNKSFGPSVCPKLTNWGKIRYVLQIPTPIWGIGATLPFAIHNREQEKEKQLKIMQVTIAILNTTHEFAWFKFICVMRSVCVSDANPILSLVALVVETCMEEGLKPMHAEQLRENVHKMVYFVADYYKSIESFQVLNQVDEVFARSPLLQCSLPCRLLHLPFRTWISFKKVTLNSKIHLKSHVMNH